AFWADTRPETDTSRPASTTMEPSACSESPLKEDCATWVCDGSSTRVGLSTVCCSVIGCETQPVEATCWVTATLTSASEKTGTSVNRSCLLLTHWKLRVSRLSCTSWTWEVQAD